MAKKKSVQYPPSGYATHGRVVYLGRATKRIYHNAQQAGLTPVNVKTFRKLVGSSMAIQRIMVTGTWFDTVKY